MVYGDIRRRSRSRSNSKSRKFSGRSRSIRPSRSRSRSRSLSRISGTVSHSKIRKKNYKSSRSRSRSRSFSRHKRLRSSRSRSTSTSRVRKLRSRSRSNYKTSRSRSRSRSFSRHKRPISSRSRSKSRVRKLRSRSRSKSRPFKNRVSRSRSRSLLRFRRSRSNSKARYKKSVSRSRSKSRCKKGRLSRSRSNSRSRKTRSKSMSKSRQKKSRSARSRSTSRKRKTKSTHIKDSKRRSRSTSLKRGLQEQPKRRSRSESTSPSRKDGNKEMVSVIKNETDKYKKVPSKEIEDDDDLQEIPVAPVTPPPLVDLASGSDDEGHENDKQENSQDSSFCKEDLRIPLAFINKKTISNVLGTSSKLKLNNAEPLGALSQVNISNDLLMPLTFGRKQPQTFVSSTQHQTVDLTENNTDLEAKTKNMSDKGTPSVYDMEDTISADDTTIDLNLGRTALIDLAIREKNAEKLSTDRKIERVIGLDMGSLLHKNTMNLTPLKSTLDKPKVDLVKSPTIKNINNAEDMNYVIKRRTIGECAAAYLREGELVSTLRIFHEMGGEMGIWQLPISALYNQLLQLQNEGGDPRKYLNQNKDASDLLNLVKGHLESCLEDNKLGAVQRVVREELLHLISDVIMGKSSHMPVECFTCYGIRTDVLACSMLDEDPEEIKEFIHNTLIYEGIYEPTDEIISTIFKAVEKYQKRFLQGQGVTVEQYVMLK